LIFWLSFLLFPVAIQADELSLDPPMPLVPGKALELDAENRHKLFSNRIAEDNYRLFRSRQIPLALLGTLAFMGALPWVLKRCQEAHRLKKSTPSPPTSKELLKALHALELNPALDRKEKVLKLSSILRMQCTSVLDMPCKTLTSQEIAAEWRRKWLKDPSLPNTLAEADDLYFREAPPTLDEWEQVLHSSEEVIQHSQF
jgi:hypothetical protein